MMAPNGIGVLLRTRREQAGLTREDAAVLMAQALGEPFDAENFKRWERETRLPTPRWHRSIESALGIPLQEIVRARAVSQAFRLQHKTARMDGEEATAVKRRSFITGTLAVAGAGALPEFAAAHEGIDAALQGSDAADIAYLESVFERNTGGYHGRDPQVVLAEMQQDLMLLRDVLERPHTARDRSTVVRTAAGLTGLVAIIQHDRGQQQDARHWFTTAARAAAESGDRQMLAWVLARHAMVPLNYGAPRAAAELAARARRVAGHTTSAAAALAAAVSSRALAATGDHRGALRAIAQARAAIERLDRVGLADTWFGYPPQKHSVHLSQAFTLLGESGHAFTEQEAALALTDSPSVMTRALLALDTAQCLRADHDPQGAADVASEVWQQLPEGFRTGLVRIRAETLRGSLTGRPRAQLTEVLSHVT
ncbi:multiprotein-bridging factor 1 family protein [Streptomyces sp. NPDC059743]|uniref:helix-turn-helix domain-containing protein n=1 Tax=Streptomyces sp. NPDC059743 TaxID=3346928 RepID=UPI00365017D0